ncbi:hypothetical protein SDC9_82179 [bioreactor metagenome]|uniref:Glycoside hydrolase family 20 catalytic domain-containing protein n=1 Tax=bioreactor metagenome TaxID=1076179 RepID=A0A644Z3Z9_9ZZZZ
MKTSFQIRAAQLDLARQMETINFIKGFIDFLADNHYNTLFLYLEWRVCTKAVDLGENARYTADELREIICYAANRKISIIPGLATLGHADLILRKSEFKHLSELRDGTVGRFPAGTDIDLCPSSEDVKELLTEYLTECADIFADSDYIHIGADEVNNIGYCTECREKARTFALEERLYLEHIKFVHALVSKLGKRVMMWDDMFELYPDILPEMPRDVILVTWLYHENVYNFRGHFFNQQSEDLLARYEQLGFEYLIAPADYMSNNIQSFTEYAERHQPMGGLLTSWEKASSLMFKYYPNFALAGHLWSVCAEEREHAMRRGIKQLFGITDDLFMDAVESYACQAQRFPRVSLANLTIFDFDGPEHLPLHSLRTTLEILKRYQNQVNTEIGKIVLADMQFDCRFKLLERRSFLTSWKHFKGMRHEDFKRLQNELRSSEQEYIAFYQQHRPHEPLTNITKIFDDWRNALEEIHSADSRGYVTLLLAQPDGYGAAWTRIIVNDKEISCNCFKFLGKPFYEVNLFLPQIEEIKEVRIESWGFGGQGVAYISATSAGRHYVPQGITATTGVVCHAEMCLRNDVNYAFLGLHDVRSAYMDRSLGTMVSSVTISMQKADF